MDAHDENASPLRSQSVKRLSTLSPFSAASPQHRRPSKQLKEQNYNRYEADPNIEMTLCEETTLLEASCLQNQSLEVVPEESDKTLETAPSLADELGALSNDQEEHFEEKTGASTLAEELDFLDQRETTSESPEPAADKDETVVKEEESADVLSPVEETGVEEESAEQLEETVAQTVTVEEDQVQENVADEVDSPPELEENDNSEFQREESVHEKLEDLPSCIEDQLSVEEKSVEKNTDEMDEVEEESFQDEETINVDATLEVSFGFGMDRTQADDTLQQVCVELVETVEEQLLIEGDQIVRRVVEEVTVLEVESEKVVEEETMEEITVEPRLSQSFKKEEDFLTAIIASELDQDPASRLSPIVGSQLEPIPESPERQPASSARLPRSQNDTSLLAQRKPNLSESLIDFVFTEKKVEYEMETAEATKTLEKKVKILEQEADVMRKERDDYQFLFESSSQKNKAELTALRKRCHELESEVETLQQKQFNESQMVNLHDLGERLDLMMKESETQAEIRESLTKELKEANERTETLKNLEEEQKQALLDSKRQIESLTQRAEELTKLTDDLKEMNRLLEESEFQSVEMVEALKQDLEEETKEHVKLAEKYKKLESDMELLVINQEDLKDRNEQALIQLKNEKEELSVLVEDLKLKVIGLEEGLKKADDSSHATLGELEKKKVELEEEVKAKSCELNNAQSNLEMSQADLQTVVEDLDRTVVELTALRHEFEEYRSQKERLTSDLETRLQGTIDRLTSEKDQLENEKRALITRMEELETARKEAEFEDQSANALEMKKLKDEFESKTAEVANAQASLELNEIRLTELQSELEKNAERLTTTRMELEEYRASADLNQVQLQETVDRLVLEKEQLELEKNALCGRADQLEKTSQRVGELEAVEAKLLEQIQSLEKKSLEEKSSEETWRQKMIDMQDLHSEEVGRVVKEKNELSQRCQKLEQDVEHRADSLQQAQSQIDSLNVALKESLEQNEIIETRMAKLQTSMDISQKSLMQTIQALGEKMDSKMSKVDTSELERQLKETNEKLVEWRRVAEERLETVNGQNKEIDEYQQSINQAQSQLDELRAELSSLQTSNKEQDGVIATLTQKAAQLEEFRLQNEGFSTAAGDSHQLEEQQKKIETLEAELLKKTKDAEKAWTMCDDMDELEENYKKQLSEQAEVIQRLKEKCGETAATGGLLNVLRPDNIERLTPGSVNNSHNESVSSAKEVFASPAQEKTYLGNTDKTQFEHEAKSPVKTNASCRQQ